MRLGDYYTYGRPVLAPACGVAVEVRDGCPDNPPGRPLVRAVRDMRGNYVVVRRADGEYSLLAHLRCSSVRVGGRGGRGAGGGRVRELGVLRAPPALSSPELEGLLRLREPASEGDVHGGRRGAHGVPEEGDDRVLPLYADEVGAEVLLAEAQEVGRQLPHYAPQLAHHLRRRDP